ncbi:MAG: STAS domain-containing protein [Planctomycetota bacterium]|nr:STAS domain-containing protein [Planctomycetota bacterium]
MEITVRNEQQALVVAVVGRLDGMTTPEFDRQSSAWVKPGQRLVLDLSQLNYISSAGLRSILALGKQMKAAGGALGLSGLSGLVEEVISLSGFNTILPIYSDVASALKSV